MSLVGDLATSALCLWVSAGVRVLSPRFGTSALQTSPETRDHATHEAVHGGNSEQMSIGVLELGHRRGSNAY